MIALGSAVGTGLFYGSARVIQTAGPAAILPYIIIGAAFYFATRALGEMCAAEPVSGGEVAFADRYLGKFWGFLLGWNALLVQLAEPAAAFNALGHYIQFWIPTAPIWVTAAVGVVFITIVNVITVSIYGEIEYWFASIKVTTISLMIIGGFSIILFGICNHGVPMGFGNLVQHGGFFPHGVMGMLMTLVLVTFAYGGTQNVGVAAGEVRDPAKSIPRATKGVLWRIIIFYVGAITVLVTLFPWDKIATTGSPFVLVFDKIGIPAAAAVLNIVVITAVLSNLNGNVYYNSRKLYKLSLQGNAPAVLSKVTARGTPYVGVLVVIGAQLFGVLMNYIIPHKAFYYFASITAGKNIVACLCILISQYNFRKIKIHNNEEDKVLFKMPFWPYSTYFTLGIFAVVIVTMAISKDMWLPLIVVPIWIAILYVSYRFTVAK
jgi:AAT family amino acid transporter